MTTQVPVYQIPNDPAHPEIDLAPTCRACYDADPEVREEVVSARPTMVDVDLAPLCHICHEPCA